jgi:starvation-inducible DNA-binding protein
MFPNNDEQSTTLIALLNARLADAIDLLYQAKQAHWNVTGQEFFALHQLFEKVADELQEHVDDIAERVAQLGGRAEGTIRMASERSSLPEYPHQISGGAAHVEALSNAMTAAADAMRRAIDESSNAGDQVSADIFVGATRAIDKLLWMVRAHVVQGAPRPEHVPTERKPEAAPRPRH